jgi:hypothetical protein
MIVVEMGFVLLVAAGVLLFLAPLVLKAWEAYCGWVFRDKTKG